MEPIKKFDSDVHHRKAMRLKGYDYSRAGIYFVTICTYNKLHIFGKIINDLMMYSAAGLIALDCWKKIPEHFPDAVLHDYVIMPNHVHGIIELQSGEDGKLSVPTADLDFNRFQHMVPKSIGSIVKGFKIGVTKQLRYPELTNNANSILLENAWQVPIWQSRYHDHIIRNQDEYNRISNYIVDNPKNWIQDRFHTNP